jgi:Xaa-Pro aminopeptidase
MVDSLTIFKILLSLMSEQNQSLIEETGAGFNVQAMVQAREMTISALKKISSLIHPGMLESEAVELAEITLREMGSTKKWHRTWVRFGVNTLLPYGMLSKPGTRLQENDIFFLDLGPIWDGFEGDAGATFVTGKNIEMKKCAEDAENIYKIVAQYWVTEKVSGQELYLFAQAKAESLGWKMSLNEANGHRLSEFPHALHHKGSIADLNFRPSPHLWVLEIQIRHPSLPFGAFYEDLLV